MASSISGRIIDRVVGSGVARWFRTAGFKRYGRCFFLRDGDLILTGNIQASKINIPNDATFALNLGVEWPYWHGIWTGGPLPKNPARASSFIQARAHPVHGMGSDYWWGVDEDTIVEHVASEVVGTLTEFAHGFWERYRDLDSVLREFEAGIRVPTGTPHRYVHAALLVRAERPEEARTILAETARRFPELAAKITERLGLGESA